ncbi:MAG TPA: hypothetical protein PK668_07245 [Myxococcota bacterium]|nr:hypothetical protein [Myxococcota bacterium]HRY92359.1 hypothetical protein [Myxococcota bacterium]
MRTLLAGFALVALACGGCWYHWDDDPYDHGNEVCGNDVCEYYEEREGSCPTDCDSATCSTADSKFGDATCGGARCCQDLECAPILQPGATSYACLAPAGGLCFNHVDPPATPVSQTGTGLYCCNTFGGAAGTGNLTSLCAAEPPVGDCPPEDTPLCCTRDQDCPLGSACDYSNAQGECACASAHACVRLCLTTAEYGGASGLPCCDGLVYDPDRRLCGLPAGQACFRHGDCASGQCSADLGGQCD